MTFYPLTDRQVWAFNAYDLVAGYPKSISSFGLPKTLKKIDAALYDVNTRKTLFFVGNQYYRYTVCVMKVFRYCCRTNIKCWLLCSYDEITKKMDQGYPKYVDEKFSGLTKVTAAFQYNGEFEIKQK